MYIERFINRTNWKIIYRYKNFFLSTLLYMYIYIYIYTLTNNTYKTLLRLHVTAEYTLYFPF